MTDHGRELRFGPLRQPAVLAKAAGELERAGLSRRELEVLRLVSVGRTTARSPGSWTPQSAGTTELSTSNSQRTQQADLPGHQAEACDL